MPGLNISVRSCLVFALCAVALFAGVWYAPFLTHGQSAKRTPLSPITITSTFAQTWQQEGETVYLLRGQCQIAQADTTMRAERIVVWRRPDPANSNRELISAFLEQGVRIDEPGRTRAEQSLWRDLSTEGRIQVAPQRPIVRQSGAQDPTFRRALAQRDLADKSAIRPAQFERAPQLPAINSESESDAEFRVLNLKPVAGGIRRIQFFGRNGGTYEMRSHVSTNTTPPERMVTITNGVTVLIDSGETANSQVGVVDISANQAVCWTEETAIQSQANSAEIQQPQDAPFQIYLEGDIVVRQGGNVLRAKQAFFDMREERAVLKDAEIRAKVPNSSAQVRVRAQTLRQLARDTFQADNAFITTSPFFKPGVRLQASQVFIEPRDEKANFPKFPKLFEDEPEQQDDGPTLWATTTDNTFFVEDFPIFYLPQFSAPAEDPDIPLREIGYQSDRIFGQVIKTRWDIFKLTGSDRPVGTNWDLNLNYLSYRGFQFGTVASYKGTDRFGLMGPYSGSAYQSFIYDTGHDNLGKDRSNLIPAQDWRGGILFRDRQDFTPKFSLQSELSYLSDRNWLEQYREQEFDTGKDHETSLYLQQLEDNWSWSVWGRGRLYDYYTTTEWLPRGDLYGIAQPLFGGLFTWSSHSYAGYANQRIAAQPTDPNDLYTVLPFEGNGNGVVLSTRHELDMPFDLGPFHLVPYALGEEAYWGDAFHNVGNLTPTDGRIYGSTQIDEGSMNRLYGTLGMRGSLEMWQAFPQVQSDIFNLNGLAHKMVFDADYSYSEANQALGMVPQYNEFDDNAQEQFRRRLLVNTYGGTLPPQFDPRFFALRSGTAAGVTTPDNEIVGNMNALRMGWRHRLQTKVGPPNAPRIKNWMTLDLEATYFPDYNRDNFGTPVGLYTARYNWNFSDRTTLVASTLFDTFDNPERLWSVGINSQRSTRGSVYFGIRNITGGSQLHSEILTASYSYVMSPRWISSMSTAYDLAEHQNRGQTLMITRVGSDFLINFGTTIDPTKNNFSLALSIEPRFGGFRGVPNSTGTGFTGFGNSGLGSLLNAPPGMPIGTAY